MGDLSSANGYRVKSAPQQLANATGQVHVGDPTPVLRRSRTKRASAEEDFGWKPAVGLVEGIERRIRWLRTVLEPEPAWLRGA
jgi:nucleoside-diphosphate-sugar epimerase